MILPLLETHLAKFAVIQTRHSYLFYLAVNFLGLK